MIPVVRNRVSRSLVVTALTALLVNLGAGNAWASSINVDFDFFTANPVLPNTYGAAAAQPGVWNSYTFIGPVPVPLLNLAGAGSGATMSVNAFSSFFQNPGGVTGNEANLLSDYFNTIQGGPYSVSFTGLQNGTYNVFLYTPNATNIAIGSGNINGVGFSYTPAIGIPLQPPGVLIPGIHFIVVSGVVVSNGTMVIQNNGGVAFDYGLSGLQLQLQPTTNPVPEPATMLLVGSGLALAVGRRMRNRR